MTTHEAAARQAKATKMANVLLAHGADAQAAAALPSHGRRIVAKLAGTKLPSETTWAVVVDQLRADALFAGRVAS